MEKEEKCTPNLLAGKWQIICCEDNTPQEWLPEKTCTDPCIWEFTEEQKLYDLSDSPVFNGKLIENEEETEYLYKPGGQLLIIDRSDYMADGFLFACYEERYRVERCGNDKIRLYKTGHEPEFESRILLQRVAAFTK